ncbi:hypothetical protein [Haliscomenobacter sp.]|uniref:hypothetical protein n=1 Tax=Haliscomenobacter sp. TaxID=2717303 RepID=UPI0035938F11
MNTVSKKYQSVPMQPAAPRGPRRALLFFIACCCILGLLVRWSGVDFLERDESGEFRLSESRQTQMERRLERLRSCEQYVLIAKTSGFYPCYNCGKDTRIFLQAGEVWKYGITIQGEKGRYRSWVTTMGLRYRVQYRGSVQDCLRQETLKIYQYALLPENTKRAVPLIRPPGNKADL